MKKKTVAGNVISVRRPSGEVVEIQAFTDYALDDDNLDSQGWKVCCTHYRMGNQLLLKGENNTFTVKETGEVLIAF